MGISGESYYDANHDDVDDDDDDPDEDDMILTDQKWKLLVIFTPMMTAEGETFQAMMVMMVVIWMAMALRWNLIIGNL